MRLTSSNWDFQYLWELEMFLYVKRFSGLVIAFLIQEEFTRASTFLKYVLGVNFLSLQSI